MPSYQKTLSELAVDAARREIYQAKRIAHIEVTFRMMRGLYAISLNQPDNDRLAIEARQTLEKIAHQLNIDTKDERAFKAFMESISNPDSDVYKSQIKQYAGNRSDAISLSGIDETVIGGVKFDDESILEHKLKGDAQYLLGLLNPVKQSNDKESKAKEYDKKIAELAQKRAELSENLQGTLEKYKSIICSTADIDENSDEAFEAHVDKCLIKNFQKQLNEMSLEELESKMQNIFSAGKPNDQRYQDQAREDVKELLSEIDDAITKKINNDNSGQPDTARQKIIDRDKKERIKKIIINQVEHEKLNDKIKILNHNDLTSDTPEMASISDYLSIRKALDIAFSPTPKIDSTLQSKIEPYLSNNKNIINDIFEVNQSIDTMKKDKSYLAAIEKNIENSRKSEFLSQAEVLIKELQSRRSEKPLTENDKSLIVGELLNIFQQLETEKSEVRFKTTLTLFDSFYDKVKPGVSSEFQIDSNTNAFMQTAKLSAKRANKIGQSAHAIEGFIKVYTDSLNDLELLELKKTQKTKLKSGDQKIIKPIIDKITEKAIPKQVLSKMMQVNPTNLEKAIQNIENNNSLELESISEVYFETSKIEEKQQQAVSNKSLKNNSNNYPPRNDVSVESNKNKVSSESINFSFSPHFKATLPTASHSMTHDWVQQSPIYEKDFIESEKKSPTGFFKKVSELFQDVTKTHDDQLMADFMFSETLLSYTAENLIFEHTENVAQSILKSLNMIKKTNMTDDFNHLHSEINHHIENQKDLMLSTSMIEEYRIKIKDKIDPLENRTRDLLKQKNQLQKELLSCESLSNAEWNNYTMSLEIKGRHAHGASLKEIRNTYLKSAEKINKNIVDKYWQSFSGKKINIFDAHFTNSLKLKWHDLTNEQRVDAIMSDPNLKSEFEEQDRKMIESIERELENFTSKPSGLYLQFKKDSEDLLNDYQNKRRGFYEHRETAIKQAISFINDEIRLNNRAERHLMAEFKNEITDFYNKKKEFFINMQSILLDFDQAETNNDSDLENIKNVVNAFRENMSDSFSSISVARRVDHIKNLIKQEQSRDQAAKVRAADDFDVSQRSDRKAIEIPSPNLIKRLKRNIAEIAVSATMELENPVESLSLSIKNDKIKSLFDDYRKTEAMILSSENLERKISEKTDALENMVRMLESLSPGEVNRKDKNNTQSNFKSACAQLNAQLLLAQAAIKSGLKANQLQGNDGLYSYQNAARLEIRNAEEEFSKLQSILSELSEQHDKVNQKLDEVANKQSEILKNLQAQFIDNQTKFNINDHKMTNIQERVEDFKSNIENLNSQVSKMNEPMLVSEINEFNRDYEVFKNTEILLLDKKKFEKQCTNITSLFSEASKKTDLKIRSDLINEINNQLNIFKDITNKSSQTLKESLEKHNKMKSQYEMAEEKAKVIIKGPYVIHNEKIIKALEKRIQDLDYKINKQSNNKNKKNRSDRLEGMKVLKEKLLEFSEGETAHQKPWDKSFIQQHLKDNKDDIAKSLNKNNFDYTKAYDLKTSGFAASLRKKIGLGESKLSKLLNKIDASEENKSVRKKGKKGS